VTLFTETVQFMLQCTDVLVVVVVVVVVAGRGGEGIEYIVKYRHGYANCPVRMLRGRGFGFNLAIMSLLIATHSSSGFCRLGKDVVAKEYH